MVHLQNPHPSRSASVVHYTKQLPLYYSLIACTFNKLLLVISVYKLKIQICSLIGSGDIINLSCHICHCIHEMGGEVNVLWNNKSFLYCKVTIYYL